MTRSGERDLSRIGGIDYALMTVGSCLAVFSCGEALQYVTVGIAGVLGIIVGASVSYGLRIALLRSKFVKLDGFLYAMAVIAGAAFTPQLNPLLPEGGYPPDVLAAGWLTWMLILGSFFTWQDATILFQAVPSISLFALAGIYSTWSPVNFAFFGFLICLATLVARAHRRAMLVQAADSGYFARGLAPGSIAPSVETTPGLARRMEDGPWKWIAGPEWALLSAFAIVAISLLGAPVIRIAIQPVSGFAKIGTPRSVAARIRSQSITSDTQESVPVGQGPNRLAPTPDFEIRTDPQDQRWLEYVRTEEFYSFTNHRWVVMRTPQDVQSQQEGAATGLSILAMGTDPHEFPFEVRLRKMLPLIPAPGFVVSWDGRPPLRVLYDGRITNGLVGIGTTISGRADVDAGGKPTQAATGVDLPPMFAEAASYGEMSPRVVQLVQRVTAGAKNDFEKAERIRAKIAETITYNINAAAIPPDVDPVEDVMFNHPEAYCDMFATAMTLMARSAGIPSRFVYGYRPGLENVDADGWHVVLESDRHAWAELFFKDCGWVIFDATDGAKFVPDAGPGASNNRGPFWTQPWVQMTINTLIGLGIVLMAVLGFRSIKIARRVANPRAELDRAYVRFTRLLERKLRARRIAGATPDEFLTGARPALGEAYPLAEELNGRFVNYFYSPQGASEEDVVQIHDRLKHLARLLRKKPR